jgi:hypothetical protein
MRRPTAEDQQRVAQRTAKDQRINVLHRIGANDANGS